MNMNRMSKRLTLAAGCALLMVHAAVRANNAQVSNIALADSDTGYTHITCDVGWDNSWRVSWTETTPSITLTNWDAAWVFVKFRVATNNAPWQHASLSTNKANHSVPAGAALDVGLTSTRGIGVFLYRSDEGSGSWTNTLKLRWEYALDGVSKTDKVDVSVLAIEMVYVPQGSFKVGSGGTESGSFTAGPWVSGATIPFVITSEAALMITNAVGGLWGTSSSGNNTIGPTGVLATAYSKGYNAFYCMKYEITQGQWVDFFNMLTDSQKNNRDITGGTYNNTGKGTDLATNLNTIAWTTGDAICTTPNRACNFLSWDDGVAYADWAGLRPMTELEFEKACRGPVEPVAEEYAWGKATAIADGGDGTINLTAAEDGTETNMTSVALGACVYGDNNIRVSGTNVGKGPVRGGLFATANSTRITSGATYWGIMEMSGNLYEQVVSAGHNTGRLFTGTTGDGTLDQNGYAHYGSWPNATATGAGFRGGDWVYGFANAKVSNRNLGTRAYNARSSNHGFRAVRQESSCR